MRNIKKLFRALKFVNQNRVVHPEGNAWNSTAIAWYVTRNLDDFEVSYTCMFALTGRIFGDVDRKGVLSVVPNYERYSVKLASQMLSPMLDSLNVIKLHYLLTNATRLSWLARYNPEKLKRIKKTGDAIGCYDKLIHINNSFDPTEMYRRLENNERNEAYKKFEYFVNITHDIVNRKNPIIEAMS